MVLPETRYVSVGDADVAYQVFGRDSPDLLFFWGLGSHVEMCWDTPADAHFLRRLGSFARAIQLDRRGTGASDGVTRGIIPTWEDWTEDVLAVLDAVGCEQAAILAEVDAGPIAILFAALHPERVRALVLANTMARALVADDYPIGSTPEDLEVLLSMLGSLWGTPDFVRATQPGLADDVESLHSIARCQRASATPRTAEAQYRYIIGVDVRDALPLIQAPTLVLHNEDNAIIPVAHGRYLADHIPGSRFVTYASEGDVSGVGVTDQFIETVAEFLTGQRPELDIDRVLTTVLFTDIVASTERLVAVGDERWRIVLDRHDRIIRDELRRFRGQEIKTTGDGFLATFDGPARAIRCARSIIHSTHDLGIEIRAGLHTGECEVRGNDVAGLAVHIAARVGAFATGGEVLVSATVKDLVAGSGINFSDKGDQKLKGLPGQWRLFAVTP